MTGLVLKLAPNERILINGAVVENGLRRSRLNILTPGVNLLRLRDAIHPDQATTPVRRLCYLTQLALSGDRVFREIATELLGGVDDLAYALCDATSHMALSDARRAIQAEQPYQALRSLRSLIAVEDALLRPPA